MSAIDNGSTTTFIYNALGQVARRTSGSTYIDYAWDAAGQQLGTYNGGTGAWWEQLFWVGGRELGYNFPGTYFIHRNALGSNSMITNYSGGVYSDALFYPWGQTWHTGDEWRSYFAGQARYEQDLGIYTPINRSYFPRLYRWPSPDPLGGEVTNPQSLNRYAYVSNNPATLTDPQGLMPCIAPLNESGDSACGADTLGGGGYGGTGYTVDGFAVPAGLAQAVLAGDFGVQCPSNFCSGFAPVGKGQIAFVQFAAAAGLGTSGYNVLTQPIPDPSLPINQIYAAYQLACQHSATPCGNNDPVSVRLQGLTYNVLLNGSIIDPNSTGIRDPLNFVHDAPSWYDFSPIDAGHYAATQAGEVDAHFDAFNGVLLFPLHEIFDYFPSLFINPKPGVSVGTYVCSIGVGCHP